MLTVEEINSEELTAVMDKHPEVLLPVEQSQHWFTYDEAFDHHIPVGTFLYKKDGKSVAVCSITYFDSKGRPSFVTVRGPVWLVDNTPRLEAEFIDTISKQAKDYEKSVVYVRTHLEFDQPKAVPTFDSAFYDRSIWIDLKPDEEDIMKSFSSTARRYIRKAERDGVEIKQIPADEAGKLFADELMDIMDETTERNGFTGFDQKVYEHMLTNMPEVAKLWVAYYEGKPVCWLIATEFRQEGIYYFGAGNDVARKMRAAFPLQYRAMLEAKKNGCEHWNLTGISSDAFPGLENVTEFKKRFSKEVTELSTMYDIPLNKLQYKAISTLVLARRKRMNKEEVPMLNVEKISAEQMETIADEHPDVLLPLEQSEHWVEFCDKVYPVHEHVGYFAYSQGKKVVALASISFHEARQRNSFWISRGPVWLVEPTQELEEEFLNTVHKQATEYPKPIVYVRLGIENPEGIKQITPTFEPSFYDDYIEVDIDKTPEEILASFPSASTRTNVRKAGRKGVEVREIPVDEVEEIFDTKLNKITAETLDRNGWEGFADKVYKIFLTTQPDIARLYVAYCEGEPAAWILTTDYRGECIYYYGAANDAARRMKANYLLQYEGMVAAAKRGNKVWNMTGIGSEANPHLGKLTRFKTGFNKEVSRIPETFDFPVDKVKYQLVANGLKAKRNAPEMVAKAKQKSKDFLAKLKK